jgi:hypothetical protein
VDARLVEGEEAGWEQLWHEEQVDVEEEMAEDKIPEEDRWPRG